MFRSLLPALICIQCVIGHAQSLSVGDKIPDIILNHLVSYPVKTARLKDFNRHCLILDFWDIYCGSCVDGFPFMEKMEKQFAGKLRVLLVNHESEEVVTNFFKKRKLAGNFISSLPACCNDKILSRLFVHQFNPHYVWINEKGIVYAITGSREMTEINIDAFIRGAVSVMAQKTDSRVPYSIEKPFLINGNGGNGEKFLGHSILTRYVNKLSPYCAVVCDEKEGYYILLNNQDIRSLYQVAYDQGDYNTGEGFTGRGSFGIHNSRTVLEVRDTSLYCSIINGETTTENSYCYELRVPKAKNFAQLKDMMQADLDRYFHLRVRFEKRKTLCWVLQADDSIAILSKNAIVKNEIDRYSIDVKNFRISRLIFLLQYSYMQKLPYPIIDETGITGGIDLIIRADLSSPESLNTALVPFGMHFRKEERSVDMLILEDPKADSSMIIDQVRNNKISLDSN